MKAIRAFPLGFTLFVHRCGVAPFEVAIAALSVWSGVMSFFNYTSVTRIVSSSLPDVFTIAFNLVYLVAGMFILTGVGWAYRNLESSGMILLATVLGVRVIALVVSVGYAPETTTAIVQGLTFGLASLVRLRSLLKNRTLVFAEDIPEYVKRLSETKGFVP